MENPIYLESINLELTMSIVAIIMAGLVFMIRMKAAKKPVSVKKIVLPPLFMSSGFLMFLLPEARVHLLYAMEAFFLGVLLSYPLITTSKFELREGQVYMKRSKAFIIILISLFLFRMFLKVRVGDHLSPMETSGLFYILAFGMIITWRISMLLKFSKFRKNLGLTAD